MGIIDKVKDTIAREKEAKHREAAEQRAFEQQVGDPVGHADDPLPEGAPEPVLVSPGHADEPDRAAPAVGQGQAAAGQRAGADDPRTSRQQAEGDFEGAQPGIDNGLFGAAANTGAGGGFGGQNPDRDTSSGGGFGSTDVDVERDPTHGDQAREFAPNDAGGRTGFGGVEAGGVDRSGGAGFGSTN